MAWIGGNEGKPVGVADMLDKLVIVYVTGYHRDVPTRKFEQNRVPGMPTELVPKDQLHADVITIDRISGTATVYRDQTIRSWALIKVARNCVGGNPLLGTMFSADKQANKATWQALHTNQEAIAMADAWAASLGEGGFVRSAPREPEVHTAAPAPAAPPWMGQQPPWMGQQAGYGQPMPAQQPPWAAQQSPWAQQPMPPAQAQQQQGGWGQQPNPQQGGWQQPPNQQPPAQAPQQSGWGQQPPQAPQQQGGWGQPQPPQQPAQGVWNQPQMPQQPAPQQQPWGQPQQPQMPQQQGGWAQPQQQGQTTLDAMAAAGMLGGPQQPENPPF